MENFLSFPLMGWHWIALGLVFLGVELLFSGFYCLWIGIAALFVGALSFLIEGNSLFQVLLFALLSVFLIGISRQLSFFRNKEPPENFLNQRSAQLIGKILILENPIIQGKAQVQIGDSKWTVHGPDLEKGSTVMVRRVEGVILIVEPYSS